MQDGFSSASEMAEKIATENKQKADEAIKAEADKKKSAEDLQKEKEAADLAKKTEEDAAAKKIADDKAAEDQKALLDAEEKRISELSKTSGKSVDDIKKEEAAAKELAEKEKKNAPDPLTDLLKELKFDSKEDLVKHLQKKDEKQKSPDELKREEQVYTANMNAFAVENNLLSLEDIHKLEELKKQDDEDLVYKIFSEEARAEVIEELTIDGKAPTEEEIFAEINEAFDKEYPLKSKTKSAVERATTKIKREADLIRKPLENAYNKAKAEYDDRVSVQNAYPEYQKTMKKIFESSVPASVSFYSVKDGDQEHPIEVELKEEDRKEILEKVTKKFQNPETFLLHQKGKTEDIQKMIEDEVERLAWKKTEKEGKQKLAEKAESVGYGKGSKVGAEESFETKQARLKAEEKANTKLTGQEAVQAAIESTRVKK